ncbi:MAG: PrgI family protein [Oscillospiraceae bacterium]|nr:PrgI family protein [Oscillospiraceae bacterium]
MEIRIPKEVRQHKETIFFGLSTRQFFCSVLAVGTAVSIYLGLRDVLGQEATSWLCIIGAAPVAVAGFFSFNCMTFEQFVWAFVKSQLLCATPRPFLAENYYYKALHHKEANND